MTAKDAEKLRRGERSDFDTDHMTDDHGQSADPVNVLQIACERFALHLTLLSDQFRDVELSEADRARIDDATSRALTALIVISGLTTTGMERGEEDGACAHFNALTDAEWGGLQSSANQTAVHNRAPVYACELEPQHPGPHMALAQAWAGGGDVLALLGPRPAQSGRPHALPRRGRPC